MLCIILSVFMLSVFMLSVFILSVFMLSVFMVSAIMQNVHMLSTMAPQVTFQNYGCRKFCYIWYWRQTPELKISRKQQKKFYEICTSSTPPVLKGGLHCKVTLLLVTSVTYI
jgi:hypothetical protein